MEILALNKRNTNRSVGPLRWPLAEACVPGICRKRWGAAGSSYEVGCHSHGRNFLCRFFAFPSASASAAVITEIRGITKDKSIQEFTSETLSLWSLQRVRYSVAGTHLCDGHGVVSEGLPLWQLCIFSFQRRQLFPLLQTSGWDPQVNQIKRLQNQHAK